MTEQQERAIHPTKPRESRAKLLYHAVRHMTPEEGCELLSAALEQAERYGHRDPEIDGFAVLRQANVKATWTLELGDDLETRLREADAILRAAVLAVDEQEDTGTCFKASTEVAA